MLLRDKVGDLLLAKGFEPQLVQEISTVGHHKRINAGEVLIHPGQGSEEMPLVLSGLLKVMKQNDVDHEIFLYYLEGGDTCAMSISCCLEGVQGSFRVVAEEDSELWMIPMAELDRWIQKYLSFRKYVFKSYQIRFDELLGTIDTVAFNKMDERIYKYLLDVKQATGSFEINKTHQEIAHELNTSRVVVSRLLKQLEKEEKIEQHRNRIEIL